MMDFMSQFPPPQEYAIIAHCVKQLKTYHTPRINQDMFDKIVTMELHKLGGHVQMGSQSLWLAYTANTLLQNSLDTIYITSHQANTQYQVL